MLAPPCFAILSIAHSLTNSAGRQDTPPESKMLHCTGNAAECSKAVIPKAEYICLRDGYASLVKAEYIYLRVCYACLVKSVLMAHYQWC